MTHGDLQFWGAYTARTLRPIWTAEELGLSYQLHPIGPRTGETQTAEYQKLTAKQKIPCMIDDAADGNIVLTESLAISRYLVRAYGNAALSPPKSTKEQAQEDEWCCFALAELDETSLYVIRRHRDLAEIYGSSETVVASCFEYLERQLKVVEAHLTDSEFVLTSGFSLADIMLTSCLSWAKAYGAQLDNQSMAYLTRLTSRSAYQRAAEANAGKPNA